MEYFVNSDCQYFPKENDIKTKYHRVGEYHRDSTFYSIQEVYQPQQRCYSLLICWQQFT